MASQKPGAYYHQSTGPWMDCFADVDWKEEARLIGTAVLMVVPLVLLLWYIERSQHEFTALWRMANSIGRRLEPLLQCIERQKYRLADTIRKKLPHRRSAWPRPGSRRPNTQFSRFSPSSTRRYSELYPYLYIWGWPSRGGVIILEHANAVDCEFLGLSHLHLFETREPIQDDEDELCQKLLHLGAKWWDSEYRFEQVLRWSLYALNEPPYNLKYSPTIRETRHVLVGWPSTGGLWVACFNSGYFRIGSRERSHHPPDEMTILKLTRTMDERCQILRDHFDAKFYDRLQDVEDELLSSWETKFRGEVGPMMAERGRFYEAISPGPDAWQPVDSEDEDEDVELDF